MPADSYNLFIFGASCNLGEHLFSCLTSQHPAASVFALSRSNTSPILTPFDFTTATSFTPYLHLSNQTWISILPPRAFAPFLQQCSDRGYLQNVKRIVFLSSSSSATKLYSYCQYDKDLSLLLLSEEMYIKSVLSATHVSLAIIRPTLIYGSSSSYQDKNLSRISSFFRKYPFFPLLLPSHTGLRQPIHVQDLAHFISSELITQELSSKTTYHSLGGSLELSYRKMLHKLLLKSNNKLPPTICLPNRLFYLLASPIMLVSPRFFEALQRIQANLSGFTKYGSNDFPSYLDD